MTVWAVLSERLPVSRRKPLPRRTSNAHAAPPSRDPAEKVLGVTFGAMVSPNDQPRGKWGNSELAALGRIAFNFSGMDWCAERLLAGFLSEDPVGLLVVSGENTSWKLDKLSAITKEILVGSPHRTALRQWLVGAKLLNKRRNTIMHSVWGSVWGPGLREGSMTRMKAGARQGEWRGESQQVDLAILEELADDIQECSAIAEALVPQLSACPEWHGQGRWIPR